MISVLPHQQQRIQNLSSRLGDKFVGHLGVNWAIEHGGTLKYGTR